MVGTWEPIQQLAGGAPGSRRAGGQHVHSMHTACTWTRREGCVSLHCLFLLHWTLHIL